MDTIIVLSIVAVALIYSIRRFYKAFKGSDTGCGCGSSCSGCGQSNGLDSKECSGDFK